jgi:hypothetical protein
MSCRQPGIFTERHESQWIVAAWPDRHGPLRSTEDEAVVGSALSQLGGLGCFEIVPLPPLDGLGVHPGFAAWMVPHPDGPVCTPPCTLPLLIRPSVGIVCATRSLSNRVQAGVGEDPQYFASFDDVPHDLRRHALEERH